MESKILISKGNISLRLMNNTKKDMKFLLNWLTNEQVVRWVYEEGVPWNMNKIVEQFAEKTEEEGSSIPCLIVYNKQEIGYLQYYPIKKDSYKFNSQDFFEKVAEGYGLDMFIGKPERNCASYKRFIDKGNRGERHPKTRMDTGIGVQPVCCCYKSEVSGRA